MPSARPETGHLRRGQSGTPPLRYSRRCLHKVAAQHWPRPKNGLEVESLTRHRVEQNREKVVVRLELSADIPPNWLNAIGGQRPLSGPAPLQVRWPTTGHRATTSAQRTSQVGKEWEVAVNPERMHHTSLGNHLQHHYHTQ